MKRGIMGVAVQCDIANIMEVLPIATSTSKEWVQERM